VFEDFGGELPAITKVSVGMSHLVTGRWYLLIGGTVLGI
jgi:Type II secretory pathway, component PulF